MEGKNVVLKVPEPMDRLQHLGSQAGSLEGVTWGSENAMIYHSQTDPITIKAGNKQVAKLKSFTRSSHFNKQSHHTPNTTAAPRLGPTS